VRTKNNLTIKLVNWIFLAVFASACSEDVHAAEPPTPLPEPLTLEAALAVDLNLHPSIASQVARHSLAKAERGQAAAQDDATLDLGLEGRWSEPSDLASYDQHNDSRASLVLQKTLHDFGRTGYAVDAGDSLIQAEERRLQLSKQEQKMAVMADYFEVILSDLDFAKENEIMATAFVDFDRALDRNEIGEVSEIDLLALESIYQEQLMVRRRAENEQRNTRQRLALTLNRPGELSSDVLPPDLPGIDNPVPDYKELLTEVEKNNPQLAALKLQLQALEDQRRSVRAEKNPRLFLHLEATEYERETASRDPYFAGLGLDVPLYRGQRTRSDTAVMEAKINALKADITVKQFELRRTLLETWQAINTLQAQREQAAIRSDYRDLYLDRSRAQYELEIKTDLGDAMGEQSAARLFSARTDYQLALAKEKLVLLTGNQSYSALAAAQAKPSKENEE